MPFFFKDLTTKEIAKQALFETKQAPSMDRRKRMQKRIDYYNDKQLEYLEKLIQDQFTYPDRLRLQKEFMNVTSMIINELAVLYSEEPIRELKNANEAENDHYFDILEKSNFNSIMEATNRLTKLTKTTLVRPVWRDGSMDFVIYTPNMFDVIMDENDPTKAKAIIYSRQFPQADEKFYFGDDKRAEDDFQEPDTLFFCWTDEKFFMFTFQMGQSGEVVPILKDNPDNPGNINPYGTLDIFVPFRDGEAIDDFFLEGGDDLITTNEIINVKKTELNQLTKMQSFSIPVRKGAPASSKSFILDPSMSVDLPADDDQSKGFDFKFVSPDARITDVQDEIQTKLRNLAVKYKLNPQTFDSSGQRSSAESIQLQNFFLSKIIKRDKPIWRNAENKLFNALKLVNNFHDPVNQLSEGMELFVDFREVETPRSLEDEDKHNLLMFQNGLLAKSEWLLKENPDLQTVENANLKLEKIKEEKMENLKQQQELMKDNPLFAQQLGQFNQEQTEVDAAAERSDEDAEDEE